MGHVHGNLCWVLRPVALRATDRAVRSNDDPDIVPNEAACLLGLGVAKLPQISARSWTSLPRLVPLYGRTSWSQRTPNVYVSVLQCPHPATNPQSLNEQTLCLDHGQTRADTDAYLVGRASAAISLPCFWLSRMTCGLPHIPRSLLS